MSVTNVIQNGIQFCQRFYHWEVWCDQSSVWSEQISCCRGAHRKGTSHGFAHISSCGLSALYKWSANCVLQRTLVCSWPWSREHGGSWEACLYSPAHLLRSGSFCFTVPVKTLHDGFCLFVCMHIFHLVVCIHRASLIAQLVNNLPAMQETLVRFRGQKDPLEKG